MGITSWIVAGLVAFVAARLVTPRRRAWWTEVFVALASASIAGSIASALDFGGWRDLDWRSALFALLSSFATIGLVRPRSGKGRDDGRLPP